MSDTITASSFDALRVAFEGELYYTNSTEHEAQRILYATDASVYREKPLGRCHSKVDYGCKESTDLCP
nr:hypothetical protein [Siphonobacter sp. SORGH_AS_1065]